MQTLALNEPEHEVGRIVIRLSNSLQLFHTLDPAPFREKELAIEAERYIVDQAEDLPKAVPIEIVIHLAEADSSEAIAPDLAPAVAQHFLVRAHEKARELRALFKSGRRSLIVGVVILSSCFAAGWLAGLILGDGPLPNIVRGKLLDPGMGGDLEAIRNLAVRLADDCGGATAFRATLGCGSGADRRSGATAMKRSDED
jgi:hypothetical protein